MTALCVLVSIVALIAWCVMATRDECSAIERVARARCYPFGG